MVAVLAFSVLSAYWRSGSHDFIAFDDDIYVFRNAQVLEGLTWEGFRWAFNTFHASNWHPLTWLSHMLDVELFGLSAGWHHRMSLLCHLLNTEILFLVLWRMTGGLWQSAFVAALFGLHPLQVESVAWVAERKNVLSTLFWMLAMGAYWRYIQRPRPGRYVLLLALHAMGLMCKPMLVTLPFVLLLLDYWPLRRFGRGRISFQALSTPLREKLPLLALSAISSVVTYLSQARGITVFPLGDFPPGLRIANAAVSAATYLVKFVWPASLAVFYPHPGTVGAGIPARQILGSIILLGGLSFLVVWKGRRHPSLGVGWLWYLGTLVPVIGLVQVGAQAMADRYTYVPSIGVGAMIAWGIPSVLANWRHRAPALAAAGCVVVTALSLAAAGQVRYWRDNLTLFTRALAVTENNWLAWNNVGTDYRNLGDLQRAISCYREAARIKPDYAMAWYNLGVTYDDLGQVDQAVAHYGQAVAIWPAYAQAWLNLGAVYSGLGQPHRAIRYYQEALRSSPGYAEAWHNLGLAFSDAGRFEDAARCYREAIRLKPGFDAARTELARTQGILARPR